MSRTIVSPAPTVEVEVTSELAARERALDNIGERRRWPRDQHSVWATLRALGGDEVPARTADNVSEGGLRVTIPIGFGVAVGQRFEVLLQQRQEPGGESRDVLGEGHYATVVRTEIMLAEEGESDRVGVGLHFDTAIAL